MGKVVVLGAVLLLGLASGGCAAAGSSKAAAEPANSQPRLAIVDATAVSPATPLVVGQAVARLGEPTATVVPPPTFTPAPSPTATVQPAGALNTLTPDATVRMFYSLLAEQRYADLRSLVTGEVYASLPDPKTLDERTPAGKLSVERAEITDRDPLTNRATVTVEVVEQVSPGAQGARHYAGVWTLVRGPSGWLLESSDLHVE